MVPDGPKPDRPRPDRPKPDGPKPDGPDCPDCPDGPEPWFDDQNWKYAFFYVPFFFDIFERFILEIKDLFK